MAYIQEHVALIVGGLCFVAAAIIGMCLYYLYMKTRKPDSEHGRQTAITLKRIYGASNPLLFYLAGVSPLEVSGAPFTIQVEGSRN